MSLMSHAVSQHDFTFLSSVDLGIPTHHSVEDSISLVLLELEQEVTGAFETDL